MKKTLAIVLVAVLFCGVLLAFLPIPASGDSLYIRKIVSLVYDDSGSMAVDDAHQPVMKSIYANYALQSLSGLLNSDDQLYVTYMSDVYRAVRKDENASPESHPEDYSTRVDLSASGVQTSIDQIRRRDFVGGGTPYKAVDVAFNRLKSIEDANVNTQYWLVIITDGWFADYPGNWAVDTDVMVSRVREMLNTSMPNGSRPQISYFAIGDDAAVPEEDQNAGLYVYKSTGASDIVSTMSQIADRVSGRSRLSAGDIVKAGSTAVTVSSQVPLLNISVLVQKTEAGISSVSGETGELAVLKSASIRYPESFVFNECSIPTDRSLVGKTYLIGSPTGNIPSGEYRIEFDKEIDLSDLVVMFEPALEIRMSVKINGKETDISSLGYVRENDRAEISCKLYEIGTDKEISPSLLPADTEYRLSVTEDGKEVRNCTSIPLEISSYTLRNVSTAFTATVRIKGFAPITVSTGAFFPESGPKYTIGMEAPPDFSMTVEQLKSNTKKIYYTIYADGVPVDMDTAKSLPFVIETEMPGITSYESDGRISFLPVYRDPITSIPTGNVNVTGTMGSAGSKTATIYIKPLEYSLRLVDGPVPSVNRETLSTNSEGVRFEAFVEGRKLTKDEIESADIKVALNDTYEGLADLHVTVEDDGTFAVVPTSDLNWWIAGYRIPTGEMMITASLFGQSATGKIEIVADCASYIIFNWVIPAVALGILLGEIIKKRFNYFKKIYYVQGTRTGNSITAAPNRWGGKRLFSIWAIIPFASDRKKINGVKFRAEGRFAHSGDIAVRVSGAYGTASGVKEYRPLAIGIYSINAHYLTNKKGEWVLMSKGNAMVISPDAGFNYSNVFVRE